MTMLKTGVAQTLTMIMMLIDLRNQDSLLGLMERVMQ
jgi:hypothetical protein